MSAHFTCFARQDIRVWSAVHFCPVSWWEIFCMWPFCGTSSNYYPNKWKIRSSFFMYNTACKKIYLLIDVSFPVDEANEDAAAIDRVSKQLTSYLAISLPCKCCDALHLPESKLKGGGIPVRYWNTTTYFFTKILILPCKHPSSKLNTPSLHTRQHHKIHMCFNLQLLQNRRVVLCLYGFT